MVSLHSGWKEIRTSPFLHAHWRWLVMLNYEVDPGLVQAHVPAGTEIEFFRGKTYVSLVGFLFQQTRVMRLAIPFHRNFEEVNLRAYVRRQTHDGWRRGVVFLKEIVPRRAIAWVARTLYNENYASLPMRHEIAGDEFLYAWRLPDAWNHLRLRRTGAPAPAAPGSEEEFITEHYWGYVAQRDGGALEYRVEHPPWRIWQAAGSEARISTAGLYGAQWVSTLAARPVSVFLAEGSPVVVYRGQRLSKL